MSPSSAATRVLYTVELLEKVLSELPLASLVRSQRVASRWHDVSKGSARLKGRLEFREPAPAEAVLLEIDIGRPAPLISASPADLEQGVPLAKINTRLIPGPTKGFLMPNEMQCIATGYRMESKTGSFVVPFGPARLLAMEIKACDDVFLSQPPGRRVWVEFVFASDLEPTRNNPKGVWFKACIKARREYLTIGDLQREFGKRLRKASRLAVTTGHSLVDHGWLRFCDVVSESDRHIRDLEVS